MPNDLSQAEEIRDLRGQIAELQQGHDEAEPEVVFQFKAPQRVKRTIYNRATGEPITLPKYMAEQAVMRRDETGYRFTSHASDCTCGCPESQRAPEYKKGAIKCFLHPESPHRDIVREIGIGTVCMADSLRSEFAMEQIAQHKHREEWKAYKEFLERSEKEQERAQAREQLEATLSLAGGKAEPLVMCAQCDYTGTKQQVIGHKSAHKAEAATVS